MSTTHDQDQRAHLVSVLEGFETAMLVTKSRTGDLSARPMALAEVREDGTIYFSTNITSPKVEEIVVDPQVLVTMQGKTKFAQLSGVAAIVKDRALVDRLWKEDWKVWFPKGKDDPSLCLIAVDPERGEYWDNSGAKGLAYLYRAAKAYLQGTRPEASRDQAAKVQL